MEAVILAGGFGSRLSHIVSDVPKPMAPVAGHPFLKYILDDLIAKGISRVVMAVGYKKESILKYFGYTYNGCEVVYSNEDRPLLTGGAMKKALIKCREQNVFVINGDTFYDINLLAMAVEHVKNSADLTIATKEMRNFERYGTVITENDRIIQFLEKKPKEYGMINGGIYLVKKELLSGIIGDEFSFETEIMEKKVSELKIYAFKCNGYFVDIGVPEDYEKARMNFAEVGDE
ncbi:nucleotidyltransferase family protein [Desulfosporosinus hippei]|uniref:D-glycero-alpha-D-manno-heptose 1-phosphate guanylyltransferase n=1 Tax=Desulfosporosinus hippei DSM 8344 TaxID=1121419 RepID=A0A1G8HIE7_9FIRM|nr:nucleotidyltransferase family protein [Desulfosporosinus hippei]SDI06477.1 D-glycero-alpha-D-manno-heptose 1-phosphate guanylyltransferase [Desulfosporosinus hippei DSM 8344]